LLFVLKGHHITAGISDSAVPKKEGAKRRFKNEKNIENNRIFRIFYSGNFCIRLGMAGS